MPTDRLTSAPDVGRGSAYAHHGEVLQGIFRNDDAEGGWLPGLVTMPLDLLGSRATFVPRLSPSGGPVSASFHPGQQASGVTGTTRVNVSPECCRKARRAAELTLEHLCRSHGLQFAGGTLRITGMVPIGLGMGSSTADVLATIRAVCDAVGATLGAQEIARLSVAAEHASDPPNNSRNTVLFAQHSGETLETLGPALPRLLLLTCRTGQSRPVDTLSLASHGGGPQVLEHFEQLRGQLRDGLRLGDVAAIGAVATASAELNQRRLAKPELSALIGICRATGGAGVQIAHSGNVASIMYDPHDTSVSITESRRLLIRHGIAVTGVLHVGGGHQTAFPTQRQEKQKQ